MCIRFASFVIHFHVVQFTFVNVSLYVCVGLFTVGCVVQRFQQTYSALQQELTNEKKQLSNIHDQRVQAKLNEKKRAAMDNYMDTLNDDTSEVCRLQ